MRYISFTTSKNVLRLEEQGVTLNDDLMKKKKKYIYIYIYSFITIFRMNFVTFAANQTTIHFYNYQHTLFGSVVSYLLNARRNQSQRTPACLSTLNQRKKKEVFPNDNKFCPIKNCLSCQSNITNKRKVTKQLLMKTFC